MARFDLIKQVRACEGTIAERRDKRSQDQHYVCVVTTWTRLDSPGLVHREHRLPHGQCHRVVTARGSFEALGGQSNGETKWIPRNQNSTTRDCD